VGAVFLVNVLRKCYLVVVMAQPAPDDQHAHIAYVLRQVSLQNVEPLREVSIVTHATQTSHTTETMHRNCIGRPVHIILCLRLCK